METVLEATLLIKTKPATTQAGLDEQLETADAILLQIEGLLESIYREGGQYHHEKFAVEFKEC